MRRRKLLGSLLGLAVVAVGAFVLWPRKDRITRENYERIREGMSRVEVEAILGPPGDFTTQPVAEVDRAGPSLLLISDARTWPMVDKRAWVEWQTDTGTVGIQFTSSEHVLVPIFWEMQSISGHDPLDILLWRAKRQWRKWFPE
jgi:hypothetical protein